MLDCQFPVIPEGAYLCCCSFPLTRVTHQPAMGRAQHVVPCAQPAQAARFHPGKARPTKASRLVVTACLRCGQLSERPLVSRAEARQLVRVSATQAPQHEPPTEDRSTTKQSPASREAPGGNEPEQSLGVRWDTCAAPNGWQVKERCNRCHAQQQCGRTTRTGLFPPKNWHLHTHLPAAGPRWRSSASTKTASRRYSHRHAATSLPARRMPWTPTKSLAWERARC